MKTAAIMAALSLGLMATPCLLAQTDKDKSTNGDQSSGSPKKVEGVVAGVTVVGETMVDYETNRAITAEKDYLTIVAPSHHGDKGEKHAKQGEQASRNEGNASAKQDKDVKQTANADRSADRGTEGSGQSSWRSASVYLVEVTPKTEVCECRDDGKKKCELAHLEIGDRVEVEFKPFDAQGSRSQNTRHGRHRIMRGEAVSISILHDKAHQDQGSNSSSQGSKEENKNRQQ